MNTLSVAFLNALYIEVLSITYLYSFNVQVMAKLESTPDTAFRTEAVKYAFIGLMRDLRGIAMATNRYASFFLNV